MKKFIRKRPFIIVMVMLLLVSEWLTFQFIAAHEANDTFSCFYGFGWLIASLLLLISAVFILLSGYVKPDIRIFKKLVTGTYGYSFWSLAGLVIFILELSWLGDVALELLLSPMDCYGTFYGLCRLLDVIFSMSMLILLLHLWMTPRTMHLQERKLLVTPVSLAMDGKIFNECNLELFLKPLKEDLHAVNEEDKGRLDSITEMVILLSDSFDKAEIKQSLQDKYGYNGNNRRFLENVIEKEYCRKICVEYIDNVNYNNFDSCNKAIDKALEKHRGDDASSAVLFISPGTAVISAVMSIFTIPEDRLLVYVNKSTDLLEVVEVDVNTTKVVMQTLQNELN